jgi:V8-like Glu-specific endopeptidase
MGPVAYLYYCKPLTSSKDFQPIIVSDYAFIFKDPVEELTKVASCYEDVMCYSPWDSMSLGVVGLESINSKYLIFCTGSVLSDNNPMTVSNLILTANHCVSTQEEADSLEFFWFYQSSVCNGDVPYLYTVPITSGGATLLATSNLSTGTDVTLLQMKNQPPDNIYEFGYANYAVNINTEVVVIHHPGGSYKRISFGKTTNSGSPYYDNMNLQPLTRFYEVKYYLSSTEAGSSGSPLISVDTGLILGQLWGGTASCSYMDEPDYFGRFDVSFQFLQPFLPIGEINYDIDGSGKIDEKDLTLVVDASLGINQNSSADLNKDGKFNASDIQLMWNKLVGEE